MSFQLPASGTLSFTDIDTLYGGGLPYMFQLSASPETVTKYHTANDGVIRIKFLSNPAGSSTITVSAPTGTAVYALSAVVGQTYTVMTGLSAPYVRTIKVTDDARSKTDTITITGYYGTPATTYKGFSNAFVTSTYPLTNIKLSYYGGQDCDIADDPAPIHFSDFHSAINYPVNLSLQFTNSAASAPEVRVICLVGNIPTLIPVAPIFVSALSSIFLSTKDAHVDTNRYVLCNTPITVTIKGSVLKTYNDEVSVYAGLSGDTMTIQQGTSSFTCPVVVPLVTHSNSVATTVTQVQVHPEPRVRRILRHQTTEVRTVSTTTVIASNSASAVFTLDDYGFGDDAVIHFYVGPGPGNSRSAPASGWHKNTTWKTLGFEVSMPNTPKLQFPS